MRGSSTDEVVFQDTPVPAHNLLGEEGRGFNYAMEILDASRIIIAAQCVGIGQSALEAALRYAQQRQTFGKPIAQHQAIQFMLADMATEVHAARLATMHAASLKDDGEPFLAEASMAKLMASEMCVNVSSKAVQVHGGIGYFQEAGVERIFRDARVTTIYEGHIRDSAAGHRAAGPGQVCGLITCVTTRRVNAAWAGLRSQRASLDGQFRRRAIQEEKQE